MILLIIAVGYVITKFRMFSEKARTDLTNIVIYIVLPCNIFKSFNKDITPEILRQCAFALLISFGMQVFYLVISKLLYIRFKPERRAVAEYATITSNAGFMWLPIIEAVFGQTGVLYASIILIPMRIFMWTAGLSLFTKMDVKQKIKKLGTHPCIWAVIFGLAYSLSTFELPAFLTSAISAVSACTTALSMLVVGSILTGVELKTVFDKDCFYYSFFRLVAIPAIVLAALISLKADPLTTGVAVLMSAMPAALATAMLSEKYGKDSNYASKTIMISTALSIVTLPIIATVLAILL